LAVVHDVPLGLHVHAVLPLQSLSEQSIWLSQSSSSPLVQLLSVAGARPQSAGQVQLLSPASHFPLPQTTGGQSTGQFALDSPAAWQSLVRRFPNRLFCRLVDFCRRRDTLLVGRSFRIQP
jgi:hypothetical protein